MANDLELVISRVFDAPNDLVFRDDVFHTYSSFGRCDEDVLGAYRLRRHDRCDDAVGDATIAALIRPRPNQMEQS
jgi:hypothetical protein